MRSVPGIADYGDAELSSLAEARRKVRAARVAFTEFAGASQAQADAVVRAMADAAAGAASELARLAVDETGCGVYEDKIRKNLYNARFVTEAILRMRRALEEYRLLGVKTNIPFHQNIMDSHRFIAGNFDTRFVEERFSMEQAEEGKQDDSEIAAILATLVAHRQGRKSAQIVQRGARDTSNWKWVGRYERMHR